MGMINQFARQNQSTLADVIALIRADGSMPIARQKTAINDIKTACRWFGMAPDDVIAHPMNIRPRFGRLSPGGLGVSTKRIQNVRSSLKAALQRVQVIDGRSFKVPLTPEWRGLIGRVSDTYLRQKVHCIASFASARNLGPNHIDDAFSAMLLEALQDDRLHSNPRITHQNAVRAWNKLVGSVSGWPKTALHQPRYRKIKTPAAPMHPNLGAEIERFLVRHSTDDPFDLATPMVPWKSTTVATYRRYFKRFVGLLITLGHPPDTLQSLNDIARFERAKAALQLMMVQNDGNCRVGASHIARLISQVALEVARRNMDDTDEMSTSFAEDARLLRDLADRLHKRNKILGQKNRKRLAPLRDEANMARLFLLPLAIAKEVEGYAEPTRGQALRMQLALALLILTFCPLRITSLSQLQIGRHLIWSRPGMTGELRLQFDWRELKSDAPEVLPLPPECARLVRKYVETYRPKLDANGSTYLFPGQRTDRGKLRGVLSGQLQTLIYSRTGFDVNPHLYRHLVHLVVLSRFPGAYAMISRILTHRSLETARKNYAYFDVELSLKAYQDLVREVQQRNSAAVSSQQIATEIDREAMRDGKR